MLRSPNSPPLAGADGVTNIALAATLPRQPWPPTLPEQVAAVACVLAEVTLQEQAVALRLVR